jgi:glycosyltransferase involved in cell wall biosynthesis
LVRNLPKNLEDTQFRAKKARICRMTDITKPKISLVVPVWNDAESIQVFSIQVLAILSTLNVNYEIVFCVDPSFDGTESEVKSLCQKNSNIKSLFFSSRVGQAEATMAGLRHSQGDATIVIDVDLQDPVELIPEMINLWLSGNPVVIPRRISRKGEPFSKKITAAVGYFVLNKFGKFKIPRNTGDYRIMDKKIVQNILCLTESHVFLRGLCAIVAQNPKFIDFHRPPRAYGKTKYNRWFGGLRSGLNGIVSYSTALLDIIIVIGFIFAFISFVLGVKYVIYKLIGYYIPPGNTQLFALVTFLGGMQLIAIGFIGLYVARIYEETKKRPRWFIADAIGIDSLDSADELRTINYPKRQL